jgi:hypothetical protein
MQRAWQRFGVGGAIGGTAAAAVVAVAGGSLDTGVIDESPRSGHGGRQCPPASKKGGHLAALLRSR